MRRLAATLLAGSMIACAPVQKPAPKPVIVELPFVSQKNTTEKRETAKQWGKKYCYRSNMMQDTLRHLRNIMEFREEVQLPRSGVYAEGDNVFYWSASLMDSESQLPIVMDYSVQWKVAKINGDSLELKITEFSGINYEESERIHGTAFTKEERLAYDLMMRPISSKLILRLGEKPEIRDAENAYEEDALFHLSIVGIDSLCFQKTNRNSVFVEIE